MSRMLPAAQQKKVLVIDDNIHILFAIREALELQEYIVHTSEAFSDVATIALMAPDCIYLDISLIGQDGREIARMLKDDARTKHIPIIIITAYPNAHELTKEARADAYIMKPFDLTHLWEMTATYTGKPARMNIS